MTDTLNHDTAADDRQAATLEHLDPHTLAIEDNVRDEAALDKAFLDSLRQHGVIVPITAVRDDTGTVRVRDGQCRTLGARTVGLTVVPVYILTDTDHDTPLAKLQRITHQMVVNDHRRALTEAQRARGIQQMLDAGASVTKIAQQLSVKKDIVDAARSVGKSAAARTALDNGQLTLTEAAALAEFEDMPDALDRLTRVAGSARFDHVVAQLREERASAEALAAAEGPWRDKGFTVLGTEPERWNLDYVELSHLLTAEGEPADEDAVSAPAQWAVILYEDEAWVDAQTGAVVDESLIDWLTDGQPDATPGEGLRHVSSVTEGTVFVPTYYCLNYAAAGLTPTSRFLRFAGIPGDDGGGQADTTHDPDTAEARADAEAHAEAARIEANRRERRMVLALNRLGAAAEQVRRDFVTKLLARKTLPKGGAIFTAQCLTRNPALISDHHADAVAAELLGVGDSRKLRALAAELPPTGDARAQVIILGLVLGALENRTPKDAWRQGGRGSRPWDSPYSVGSAEYLGFLTANGYPLSEVETVITGARSADAVYDATLNADAEESADPREPAA